MHVIVVAAFAVSAALGQGAPPSPNQPTAPPVVNAPPPAMVAPAATPPAPLDAAPMENTKESLLASEGDGRWGLIAISTSLGLGVYGPMIPLALGLQDGSQIAGAYLLTAAAGFFVPFGLTINTPVTWGMTNMFWGGASHGPGHAALVMALFKVSFMSPQPYFATSLGFGIAETAAGMFWANAVNMTAGTAHSIIVGSDIAAAYLFGLSIMIVASNPSIPVDVLIQLPSGFALAGAAGGAVAGAFLGPMLHLTWGDAELFQVSAALGAFVPVPFIFWATPLGSFPDIRAVTGAMLVGAAGGVAASYFLLGQGATHLELGQALTVDLGTVAGGLVGLGVSLLFNPFTNPNGGNITMTTVMVGAVGGYAVSYVAMKSSSAPKKLASSQVQLTVNPLAFTDALHPKTPGGAPIKLADRTQPPAVALVGTF